MGKSLSSPTARTLCRNVGPVRGYMHGTRSYGWQAAHGHFVVFWGAAACVPAGSSAGSCSESHHVLCACIRASLLCFHAALGLTFDFCFVTPSWGLTSDCTAAVCCCQQGALRNSWLDIRLRVQYVRAGNRARACRRVRTLRYVGPGTGPGLSINTTVHRTCGKRDCGSLALVAALSANLGVQRSTLRDLKAMATMTDKTRELSPL